MQYDDLRAMARLKVSRSQTLNTWLDKCALDFHSMDRPSAAVGATRMRVETTTCELAFEAPHDEAKDELIRSLS
jgi:hypothetical protein